MQKFIFFLIITIGAFSQAQQKPLKVAFLSDIHFQDLYGNFSDSDFKGAINPKTGKPTILRSMNSQLHSTRIFNENYFAFLQALEDIAKKNIKIVALPGDFSDDGQAYNVRGLKKILEQYQKKYGLDFYITTGNHDPVGPWRREDGKNDFLNNDGGEIGIYSESTLKKNNNDIITNDIAELGYTEILDQLKDFGFFPKKENIFWNTPFDSLNYQNYCYKEALQHANIKNRMFEIAKGFMIPDLSYIVEPIQGLWLLAIDGNTYIPKNINSSALDPDNFNGASIGYNNVLVYKKHLIKWVANISKEAKSRGKTLVAFTHYPMIDYNDGASPAIANLLGKKKWQLDRVPSEDVAKTFSEAGLQIHFAGHMHINDTGIRQFGDKILVNVQVPSLAAYIPAYKILTIYSSDKMDVKTVILHKVQGFKELFPLYKKEYEAMKSAGDKQLWDKRILKSRSYGNYMAFHLKELVRLRMIPSDWPPEFYTKAKNLTGEKLLLLVKTRAELRQMNINLKDYNKWEFDDAILDLYKYQAADELAKYDIPKKRLLQYTILEKIYKEYHPGDEFMTQLQSFFKILSLLSNSDLADHFEIDLPNRKLKRL